MDGELPEEVDQAIAALRQAEPEDKGGEDHAEYFLEENNKLHLVEKRELFLDLVAMQPTLPMARLVMRIFNDSADGKFGVKHQVFRRYDALGYGPDGAKDTEIEQRRSIVRDFESEKKLRIDDCGECKDRGKCAGYEGHEASELDCFVLGELGDILVRRETGHVGAPFEEMPEFIELAELPLGERGVLPGPDLGGVLLVFAEVAEEVVHEEVSDDKGGHEDVHEAGEDEAASKAVA